MAWSDFLSDVDWGGAAKSAVPAIAGTYLTTQANQRAINTLAQSAQAAAGQLQAGNQAAQARYQQVQDRTAPAVNYLQQVVADGPALTPGQQQRVLDTRRQTGQALASKLGGRSATAIATRAAQDLENNVYGANRARSDQAAGQLAGQNLAAVNASAGADQSIGQNMARITQGTGEAQAQAGLSTAQAQGKMVGDLVNPQPNVMSALKSYMADDRKSNYGN